MTDNFYETERTFVRRFQMKDISWFSSLMMELQEMVREKAEKMAERFL